MNSLTQFHWSGMADERIAITMLEDEQWMEKFLDTSRKKLAASNKLMRQLMDDAGIKYSHGSNAGFFLLVDLSPWLKEENGKDGWEREEVLMKKLLNNKVFISNGGSQAAEEPGFFRVVASCFFAVRYESAFAASLFVAVTCPRISFNLCQTVSL